MEETTYRNPRVVYFVNRAFIAVRADQDADPDLSRRYEDYGWPATIVFAPDGSEIVKRRGYIPPAAMAALLDALIPDRPTRPSVGARVAWKPSSRTTPSSGEVAAITRAFTSLYDPGQGGWGTVHKLLDAEPLELALADPRYYPWAKKTLDGALALIDPVSGGMYQYSDAADWSSPHFEKIMAVQTEAIAMYLLADKRVANPIYRSAALAIGRYLADVLGDGNGGFYTSQDADLDAVTPGRVYYGGDEAARKKRGIPPIDKHQYARENGWAIRAFVQLYEATHEARYLDRARRAAAWVEAHRSVDGGGFTHGDKDARPGAYLGDTLAMAQAYVALAAVDAAGPWLARAQAAADYIDAHFRAGRLVAGDSGYFTAAPAAGASGVFVRATRLVDENVAIARLMHTLAQRTHAPRFAKMAAEAMHFLTSPTLAAERPFSPGVLVAASELLRVGSRPEK